MPPEEELSPMREKMDILNVCSCDWLVDVGVVLFEVVFLR